eukprot:CFRG7121T1
MTFTTDTASDISSTCLAFYDDGDASSLTSVFNEMDLAEIIKERKEMASENVSAPGNKGKGRRMPTMDVAKLGNAYTSTPVNDTTVHRSGRHDFNYNNIQCGSITDNGLQHEIPSITTKTYKNYGLMSSHVPAHVPRRTTSLSSNSVDVLHNCVLENSLSAVPRVRPRTVHRSGVSDFGCQNALKNRMNMPGQVRDKSSIEMEDMHGHGVDQLRTTSSQDCLRVQTSDCVTLREGNRNTGLGFRKYAKSLKKCFTSSDVPDSNARADSMSREEDELHSEKRTSLGLTKKEIKVFEKDNWERQIKDAKRKLQLQREHEEFERLLLDEKKRLVLTEYKAVREAKQAQRYQDKMEKKIERKQEKKRDADQKMLQQNAEKKLAQDQRLMYKAMKLHKKPGAKVSCRSTESFDYQSGPFGSSVKFIEQLPQQITPHTTDLFLRSSVSEEWTGGDRYLH